MRYLPGFVFVLALAASTLSVSAQDAEEGTEPELKESMPSSEPGPEEPSLQLQLDSTGVEVVPSPSRTPDGYMVEKLELRVRRARLGLIAPAALIVAGVPPLALGRRGADCDDLVGEYDSDYCRRLRTAGLVLTISGTVGMITGLTLYGARQRALDWAERGYRLEELELRAKRAKIGLGVSAVVLSVGTVMTATGFSSFDFESSLASAWAGVGLMVAGGIGMIATGAILGSQRTLLRLQEAHYARPRRVQWDHARSRLVF